MAPNLLPTFWTLFGFIFQQGELRRDISCWRVPNRLGGMRDLAIFRGDIRDLSRKQGISVASGSAREFVFLGGWDARLARETERDTGFQFQRDFIPAQKPQAGGNEPFVRIAVSGFKY